MNRFVFVFLQKKIKIKKKTQKANMDKGVFVYVRLLNACECAWTNAVCFSSLSRGTLVAIKCCYFCTVFSFLFIFKVHNKREVKIERNDLLSVSTARSEPRKMAYYYRYIHYVKLDHCGGKQTVALTRLCCSTQIAPVSVRGQVLIFFFHLISVIGWW